MYFSNEEHEENYIYLMQKNKLIPGKSIDFEAVVYYIASYPEVYKCFEWNVYHTEFSPLGDLLFRREDGSKGYSSEPLTSATWSLVELGQSLFNGYKVDVSSFPLYNEEIFNVMVQACKIRGGVAGDYLVYK
jgi:hypothetical protein